MKAVSFALAGLAAAGVALAAHQSTAAPRRAHVVASSSCAAGEKTIGSVKVVGFPKLWLNGKQRKSKKSFSLHAKDRLRMANRGEVDFCLKEGGTFCRAFPGAKLRVVPNDQLLLNVRAGAAQCSTSEGYTKNIAAGHARLRVGDPVFGVSVTKNRTAVKVFLGAVEVRGNDGQASPVVVSAGTQTLARPGAAAVHPVALRLLPARKANFQKLAVQLPKPGLTKPVADASDALTAIFARDTLVVDLDKDAVADSRTQRFTESLLGKLAKTWGVALKTRFASSAEAAAELAKGSADVFVTAHPEEVTAAGVRLRLGDAAGVAAVPFMVSDKALVQLATRSDAGLATALRRYLAAAVLQSGVYATSYVGVFRTKPLYGRLGDLAFPTAAHATGVSTVVHQGFKAVVKGRLGPGLTVSSTVKGTCTTPSSATSRSDAWSCTDTTQRTWDPCFSGIQDVVVCPSDPPATEHPVDVVKLLLTKPLQSIPRVRPDPTAGPARRILATDRTICEPTTGTKPSFGSRSINDVCRKADGTKVAFLAGQPYAAGAPWAILSLPPDWQKNATAADTVGIAAIWFW